MTRYLNDLKKDGDVPSTKRPPLPTSVSSAPSPTTVDTVKPPHPQLWSPQTLISTIKTIRPNLCPLLCLLYLSVDISEIQISWVGRSTSAHCGIYCIYSNPLLIGYLGWREEWSIQRHIHHVALIYFQKMLQVLVKHTSKVSICSKSTHSQLIAIPKDCGRSSINQICLYFLVSSILTSTCLPDKQREREKTEKEGEAKKRKWQEHSSVVDLIHTYVYSEYTWGARI